MEPKLIILKPAELILKGAPVRARFEAQLIRNIKAVTTKRIERTRARILVHAGKKEIPALKRVLGIITLSPAVEIKTNLNTIQNTALKLAKLDKTKSFAVRAKRVTKEFNFTSQQINEKVGAFVQKKTKAKVNLNNPDITIYIEVLGKRTFIFTEVIRGYGGLPVGTQGKVVCLMSGGMDSPVAAWMMLKRGCEIIPLHLRVSEKEYSKFLQLIKQLQKFSAGHKLKPNIINWKPVLNKLTNKLHKQNKLSWTCVFCKHQMLLEAEKLANKEKAKAVVIGSSLGQVASQTLENIAVTHSGIEMPILTPLIGFNKDETEKIAREIGTYDISAKGAGKAVCPFLPDKPCTAAQPERFKQIKKNLK